jgi:hypothetical protein
MDGWVGESATEIEKKEEREEKGREGEGETNREKEQRGGDGGKFLVISLMF